MKKIFQQLIGFVALLAPMYCLHAADIAGETVSGRWSAERANEWFKQQP